MLRLSLSFLLALPLVAFAQSGNPICINGLTVTLQPDSTGNCLAWVRPADIVFDCESCGEDVEYALYNTNVVDAGGAGFLPEFSERTRLLPVCHDREESYAVTVFSRDANQAIGNCETYILVQASTLCEPPYYTISGRISTETGDSLQNAQVVFHDNITPPRRVVTDSSGLFTVGNLDCYSTRFDLRPSLDTLYANGVTIADLIKINKHILGVQPLNSPYKLIAADIDNSGAITTEDLVQLNALLLGQAADFPNNTSWRFVPSNHIFSDPANPWLDGPLPESMSGYLPVPTPAAFHFIGIKIGDVNNSASTH